MLQEHIVTVTTNAEGAAEVYAGSRITGVIRAMKVAIGDSDSLPLVISGERTGVPILTETFTTDKWVYPRAPAAVVANGSASTITECEISLFRERIKVVAASATASKTSTVTFYVDVE